MVVTDVPCGFCIELCRLGGRPRGKCCPTRREGGRKQSESQAGEPARIWWVPALREQPLVGVMRLSASLG